jgi:hypothetical protein
LVPIAFGVPIATPIAPLICGAVSKEHTSAGGDIRAGGTTTSDATEHVMAMDVANSTRMMISPSQDISGFLDSGWPKGRLWQYYFRRTMKGNGDRLGNVTTHCGAWLVALRAPSRAHYGHACIWFGNVNATGASTKFASSSRTAHYNRPDTSWSMASSS